MDAFEKIARQAYFSSDPEEKQSGCDYMYYLWCGKKSPLFGKDKMTTFERMFIADKDTHAEPKNAYYSLYNQEEICEKILHDFNLVTSFSHIINGHVPVKAGKRGKSCESQRTPHCDRRRILPRLSKTTGIAGYTLIYNSHGMRIVSHQPFGSIESYLEENQDIESHSDFFAKLR